MSEQLSQRSVSDEWDMQMPPEWKTGEWDRITPLARGQLPYGEALLIIGTLDDGTNFFALCWPAGQRIARCGPATDWALQEHFTGRVPKLGEEVIDRMWKVAVESTLEGKALAEAGLGPPPR